MAYGFGAFGKSWGYGGLPARAKPAFSPIDLAPDLWMPSDPLAMFKTQFGIENVGANDDTIGLILDQSQMGGKPLPDFAAAQPEQRETGTTGQAGNPASATYDAATGEGIVYRADASNYSWVRWTDLNTSYRYRIDIQNNGASRLRIFNGAQAVIEPGQRIVSYFAPSAGGVIYIIPIDDGATCPFTIHSFKTIPGNHAAQPTATSCPKYKAIRSRQFDGSDDCLIGSLKCGAEGNSILAKVSIPEVLDAGAKIIAGLNGAAVTNRFYVGVNGATGTLLAGVGSSINPAGVTYTKGQTGIVELTEDTVDTYLYWNGKLEYSEPRSAAPSTTVPYFTGARNNNGTPANFFPGAIEDLLIFQRAITPTERAQILNYWS